jgi:hypothetical protein
MAVATIPPLFAVRRLGAVRGDDQNRTRGALHTPVAGRAEQELSEAAQSARSDHEQLCAGGLVREYVCGRPFDESRVDLELGRFLAEARGRVVQTPAQLDAEIVRKPQARRRAADEP